MVGSIVGVGKYQRVIPTERRRTVVVNAKEKGSIVADKEWRYLFLFYPHTVNALCHRQYEKYNLTIGIAIYDDRIEIENPGMLPPQLTPETIKQPHISYPYNPIIADVLFKTTFLENWGSGAVTKVTSPSFFNNGLLPLF